MAAIHIIITEDNSMFLAGLHSLLQPVPGIKICGTAQNGQELLNLLKTVRADLVLMDIQMPVMDGIQATARIVKEYPATRVMALSYLDDDYKLLDMIRAGCQGYVNKNASVEMLVQTIQNVHAGQFELCNSTSLRIQNMIRNDSLGIMKHASRFSETELRIIRCMCQEYSNREIMKSLYLTSSTLKRMIKQIKSKCQADTRHAIIRYALMNGLHTDP